MKKFIYMFAAAALTAGMSSCNDILDVNSTTQLSDAAIWSKPETADGYVIAAYQTFTDHANVWSIALGNSSATYYDAYTDLIKSTSWDEFNYTHNKTMMMPTQFGKNNAGPFASWDGAYGRIKRTNLLLNDIDRYGTKFGEDWCEIRRAEARFCNAINYWFLARVYGGVVIRTHNSGINGLTDDGAYEQDCNRARVSEEETYDYIIKEMQWAIERLPVSWEDKYVGRATKGMVYGFLSRIALYAHKWEIAADAADKCKELGGYGLVDDFSKLFNNANDATNRKEIIYALYGADKLKVNDYDAYMRPFGDAAVYTTSEGGRFVPTAELADMYEYTDGTDFDWNTWKTKKINNNTITDPFSNREPRFQATILYNGAKWEKRTIETFVGATSAAPNGADYFDEYKNSGSTNGHTCTGYYLRKFLLENHTTYKVDRSWNTDIILRYAEVLLNKAEALAELGRIDDALVPLNEVRARVNLPAKTRTDAPDYDAFMKLLRKERCCELAGEGLRFWDLRRWRIAGDVINGKTVHGVKISRRTTGSLTYTTVDADGGNVRTYQDRYNYFSIPAAELTNNKLCVDNPGW